MGQAAWRRAVSSPVEAPPPFRYGERAPSVATDGLVLSFWYFQADEASTEPYTVFPDGCASVGVVRFPGGPAVLTLVGPRAAPLHPAVTRGMRIWGFRLWPDAIGPLLGVTAPGLRDHYGALPVGMPPTLAAAFRNLPASDDPDVVIPELDRALAPLVAVAGRPDPRVRAAVSAIVRRKGEGAMADVAREAAVGLRHLQRLFPDATGLTLREYARIRRFREALAMRLTPGSRGWSQIAATTGFVDQAHLARECVALSGLPPTTADRQLRRTEHQQVRP